MIYAYIILCVVFMTVEFFIGRLSPQWLAINTKRYVVLSFFVNLTSAISSVAQGVDLDSFFTLIAVNILLFMAECDMKEQMIPSVCIAPFALVGLISCISRKGEFIFVIVFALFVFGVMMFWQKRSKGGIGLGDVFILSSVALYNLPHITMSIVILSLFFCLIYGAVSAVRNKSGFNTSIPFVPFLLLAFLIIKIFIKE